MSGGWAFWYPIAEMSNQQSRKVKGAVGGGGFQDAKVDPSYASHRQTDRPTLSVGLLLALCGVAILIFVGNLDFCRRRTWHIIYISAYNPATTPNTFISERRLALTTSPA